MEGINVGKLLVSGIVAGVIMTISQLVLNEGLLGGAQQTAFDAMGVSAVGGSQIGMFVVMTFVASCTMMWLYAVLRHRSGPGAGTAACAGLVVWVLYYFQGISNFWILGMFGTSPVLIALVWGLVELPVAAIAGAYFYSD